MTFLIWLEKHNFHELSALLAAQGNAFEHFAESQSTAVSHLQDQMDSASRALATVASHLSLLAPLIPYTSEGIPAVSAQALVILRTLESRPNALLSFSHDSPPSLELVEFPSCDELPLHEPGLLFDDLEMLVSFGFIRVVSRKSNSVDYSITRSGLAYCRNSKGEQAAAP